MGQSVVNLNLCFPPSRVDTNVAMNTVAIVSTRAARELDEDLPPLSATLRQRGAAFDVVDWDDPSVDWSRFRAAVVRSTWDYTQRLPEFLAWMERVSAQTKLINPAPVLRWNTDKHYLAELERAGAPIVPSGFIEPGEDAARALEQFIARHEAAEIVVKPSVSAGSRDTMRHARGDIGAMLAQAQPLLKAGRSLLLQPYLDKVDEHGETALIFFNGAFSHAIRKAPLLRRGEEATRALFAAEKIAPRTPQADELRVAQQILSAIPFGRLLYARVDLIRDAAGAPRLLELELTEPSLFFDQAPGAVDRFVDCLLD